MTFLEEFKQKCLAESTAKFSEGEVYALNLVPIKPILAVSYHLIHDLALPPEIDLAEIEDEVGNWFYYIIHKGIAASIASRFGRDDISLIYSFEEGNAGKHPSYSISLAPIEGEYSYNLRWHLPKYDWKIQEIFWNVMDFLKANAGRIKEENVSSTEILVTLLPFAGIVGINFTNRIDLTKDDYWPIRSLFINNNKEQGEDQDLIEIDRLGEFEEPFAENKDTYQVNCSYCGKPALIVPKAGDIWNEAILEPCDHFAYAFISNTNNHLYGRSYYKKYFKSAVVNYVETFKGYTCQGNVPGFINDFLNGGTDLKEQDRLSIMEILESDLPDCNIQTKQFEKELNGNRHVFDFHFMKFV